MSNSEVQMHIPSPRPEPITLKERLARFNYTPEGANALVSWYQDLCSSSDLEYDQGDVVSVDYDQLYDLILIAEAALEQCRSMEEPQT